MGEATVNGQSALKNEGGDRNEKTECKKIKIVQLKLKVHNVEVLHHVLLI